MLSKQFKIISAVLLTMAVATPEMAVRQQRFYLLKVAIPA